MSRFWWGTVHAPDAIIKPRTPESRRQLWHPLLCWACLTNILPWPVRQKRIGTSRMVSYTRHDSKRILDKNDFPLGCSDRALAIYCYVIKYIYNTQTVNHIMWIFYVSWSQPRIYIYIYDRIICLAMKYTKQYHNGKFENYSSVYLIQIMGNYITFRLQSEVVWMC